MWRVQSQTQGAVQTSVMECAVFPKSEREAGLRALTDFDLFASQISHFHWWPRVSAVMQRFPLHQILFAPASNSSDIFAVFNRVCYFYAFGRSPC